MKWINRGEELNAYKAEKLEHEKFYVFGAGDIGRGLYVTLLFFRMFAGFIDNDVQKQKSGFCGQPVQSYQWFLENERDKTLIIAASETNEREISRQLREDNCKFYLSGIFLNRVLPIYFFKKEYFIYELSANLCDREVYIKMC